MSRTHIAVLMMVKNEKKRLHVSLESVKDIADSIVIYDTGSTDNTLEIAETFAKKHNILLRIKNGEFINFEVSRNVALDFADTFEDIEYILMLDTNDELREYKLLREYIETHKNEDKSAYLVSQEWWSGHLNKYYNVRLIKARKGWRYVGVVHEYICNSDKIEDDKKERLPENIVLYQDRTQDDDKTGKRFHRDEILLKNEYIKNPVEPRTVFYLAQTYSCLNDTENALYYYKIRTTLVGFYEERFESFLKCGEFSEKLKLDWHDCMAWYMKAFELIPRVEPLIKIGEHYRSIENWVLAYTFLSLSCKLKYPEECILFVDRLSYEYKRWHLLGISAFYAGFIQEGKAACKMAIENGTRLNMDVERDRKNLEIYENREKEIAETKNQPLQSQPSPQPNHVVTKNEFINYKIQELKKENPKSTDKQLQQIAKVLWKNKAK